MNESIRNEIAVLLIEGFGGKPFTFKMLAKALGDNLTSRRLAYKVMAELEATELVVRTKVTGKDNKLVAGWKIDDSDEENAISLWSEYLSE